MRYFAVLISLITYLNFSAQELKVYKWAEVKHASADTIYGLSLANLKLTALPDELFRFKNLKYLDLGRNKFIQLPEKFATFSNLEYLNLEKNKFVDFPLIILKLIHLKTLIINRNEITQLPINFDCFQELEVLDIWAVPLIDFPEAFLRLPNLIKLDARGISRSKSFQEKWIKLLSKTKIYFDVPCNCG